MNLSQLQNSGEDAVPKEFERVLDKETLQKEIDILDDREKEIMTLRYGLNNTEEYTQKEVAEMLGISQSYISRIEKKIIKKLQNILKI